MQAARPFSRWGNKSRRRDSSVRFFSYITLCSDRSIILHIAYCNLLYSIWSKYRNVELGAILVAILYRQDKQKYSRMAQFSCHYTIRVGTCVYRIEMLTRNRNKQFVVLFFSIPKNRTCTYTVLSV